MIIFLSLILLQVIAQDQAQTSPAPPPLTYIKSQEHIQYFNYLKSTEVAYTKGQIAEIGAIPLTYFIMYLHNSGTPIKKILVLVGQEPINPSFQNGYFGLALARLIAQRKFEVEVALLHPVDAMRSRLAQQCKKNGVKLHFNILSKLQKEYKTQLTKYMLVEWLDKFDLLVDAMTSQTVELTQPIREFVHAFSEIQKKVLSIDLPSGWNANEGNIHGLYNPKYLFSIGIPLKGVQNYKGIHGIGGRFGDGMGYNIQKYREDEEYLLLQEFQ